MFDLDYVPPLRFDNDPRMNTSRQPGINAMVKAICVIKPPR
jgi:hypothetical protein